MVGDRRQAHGENADEGGSGEEIRDLLDVGVASQRSLLDGAPQDRDERPVARLDDPFGVQTRERRVALELAEHGREDPPVERIAEDAREVADPVEEERMDVVAVAEVDVDDQLMQGVRDELFLRGPAPVDGVSTDTGARGDRLDRRGLESALRQELERRVEDLRAGGRPAWPPSGSNMGGAGAPSHLRNLAVSEYNGLTGTLNLVTHRKGVIA